MDKRLQLQAKLEELLGSENVYYQPPASISMKYPAIKYSKNNILTKNADDTKYITSLNYEITVIDPRPDNKVIDLLLELPMCSYNRHYKSDNLNHDVLTLYY